MLSDILEWIKKRGNILDKCSNWVKNLPSEVIRVFVLVFFLTIVLLRAFNKNIRESIDLVNIILFSVVILAFLRKDIKQLISKIKGVGFPGLQIPIDALEKDLSIKEKLYSNTIKNYINVDQFRDEHISSKNQDIKKTLHELQLKIEEELNLIASEFNKLSQKKDNRPINPEQLTDYLISREVIGKDVYQIVKQFFHLRKKQSEEHEDRRILDLGLRLLILLDGLRQVQKDLKIISSSDNQPFSGKPQGIELGGIQIKPISKKLISLYTTANLIDSLKKAYPIVELTTENFKIFEKTQNGTRKEAKITKIEPLENKIPLSIILAIDTSKSMRDKRKLVYAKKAAIELMKKLTKFSHQTNLKIALYPFNTENRTQFVTFSDNSQWTNNFEELEKKINKLKANGGTPLYDALNHSINKLKKSTGSNYVICLSDGEENESKKTTKDYEINLIGKKSNIPVFTIGYGEDQELQFLVNFSKITAAGKEGVGSFMKIAPKDLSNVFGYLSGSIAHTYGVYWEPTSDLITNTKVSFDIEVQFKTAGNPPTTLTIKDRTYTLK